MMRTRLQYCQTCQQRTAHKYEGVSWILTILLCLIFFPVGLIYLYMALKRADRTAQCTVPHQPPGGAGRDEELRALILSLGANAPGANGQAQQQPRRGTGFMH